MGAVQFDAGMGPDPPVSYSLSQEALKFLMTKSLFPGPCPETI